MSLLLLYKGAAGGGGGSTAAGPKSMFRFWMGMAGSPGVPVVSQAGRRSMLAFWMGGGTQHSDATTTPTTTRRHVGKPHRYDPKEFERYQKTRKQFSRKKWLEDIEAAWLEAQAKADRVTNEKQAKALHKAAQAAEKAIAAVENSDQFAELGALAAKTLNDAVAADKMRQSIAEAKAAMAMFQQIHAHAQDQDDEEAMMLLLN